MPIMAKTGKEYKAPDQSYIEQIRHFPEEQQKLINDGYDSVSWVSDKRRDRGASGWGDDKSQFFVLKPQNIRSRFAAFDPAKKDSANLLASILLPATALGYGMAGTKSPLNTPPDDMK